MHECPECGQACYCNGDIDDIQCDWEAANCTHCPAGGLDDDDEFEDPEACSECGYGLTIGRCSNEDCEKGYVASSAMFGEFTTCPTCGGKGQLLFCTNCEHWESIPG